MDHLDALITTLVTVLLGVCGVAINRSLSQYDDAIENLWAETNRNREAIHRIKSRLSVIEALKGIRPEEDDE